MLLPASTVSGCTGVDIGPGGNLVVAVNSGMCLLVNPTTGAILTTLISNTAEERYAMVLPAGQQLSVVTGTVSYNGSPLAGVTVQFADSSASTVTNSTGDTALIGSAGSYTLNASLPGFSSAQASVTTTAAQTVTQNFSLSSNAAAYTTIGSLKSLSDGTAVQVAEFPVITAGATTLTDGTCYVEDMSRTSGIRVVNLPVSAVAGDLITFIGSMDDPSTGERFVSIGSVTNLIAADTQVAPLGMANKSVSAKTAALFITVWGKVTSTGSGYIKIDDGSGLNIKVITGAQYSVGTYVIVSGISDLENDSGVVSPIVKAIDIF